MSHAIDRAEFWLEHGFGLLPCQPNKKALVSGFGQSKSKITDMGQAVKFWGHGVSCNMAVLAPEGFYILDFDIQEVYIKWAQACPEAARSYSEATPNNGTHVWMQGTPPEGIKLIDGAELKRIVLVDPSIIDGKSYKTICEGEIISLDAIPVLSPISKPGHATPYAQHASAIRRAAANPLSHVDQIKKHFTISQVLTTYRPNIRFINGNNGFQSCQCPLENHKSKAPFFFKDAQGFWKCHACEIGGDVINLYARLEAVNLREAISRMWSDMAVRS